MNKQETQNVHACQFIYGKVVHAMMDYNGNFYCARCFKRVLLTQVIDRLRNKYYTKTK